MRTPSMVCRLSFTLTLVTGCASAGVPERQSTAAGSEPSGAAPAAAAKAGRLDAPVTYAGRLPCADCPGIQLTVTLLPDSTFRLRQVYQDRPAVFHDLGRWSVEEHGTRLVLRGDTEAPQLFQIVGADSLRILDSVGRPIHSQQDYSLVRAPQVDAVRDTMRLRGTYTYMADAGRFTECRSGVAFPVAQVGANAALERAYGEAHPEPGAPLLVSFRGHFEERPAMEGDRRMEFVVVDSFERVWPGATCAGRTSGATLENTDWRLLELGGRPAGVAENTTKPYLQLDPAQKQARGSTGCNRFFGPYVLSGDSLRFGPLASTRRACLDQEMNRQERAFLEALSATRRWQVTEDTLVLTGEAGPVARFAAQHMK
jgi:copper homeostasis protein (lipoprotein)